MRKGAVYAALVYFEVPNYSRQQDNRRLNEEVALLFNPRAVEVEHYGVARLVSVGYVCHEVGIDGVAAVRAARVVKVDDVELRRCGVLVHVAQQRVVGYDGQVVELVVVDVSTVTL